MAGFDDLGLKPEYSDDASSSYLGNELLEKLAIIADWNLDTPKARSLCYQSADDREQIEVEYKRFMALILLSRYEDRLQQVGAPAVSGGDLAPSDKVDRLWHGHMVLTQDYHSFSQQAFGEYIHHHYEEPPGAGVEGKVIRRTLGAYFDDVDVGDIWAGDRFISCWPEGL